MFKKVFMVITAFLLLCSTAHASVGAKEEGTMLGEAIYLNFVGSNIEATTDGTTVSVTVANKTRQVNLPLTGFTYTSGAPISTSTAPGLEIDNLIPGIVWSDGEVTPVQITFRVPSDYLSGGAFYALCDSSSSTTAVQVDYSVYVNGNNTAWDSAASDQLPVEVTTGAGTPCQISLSPSTDFSALAAGKYVTLNLWRDNDSTGTGDLEVSNVAFYYTGD